MTDILTDKKVAKIHNEYFCKSCNYKCCKKYNFNKHLETAKHQILTSENQDNINKFKCECGRAYKHRQSLFSHKKKCTYSERSLDVSASEYPLAVNESVDYKGLILQLVKENKEFKELIFEQQKQIGELIPKIGNNNQTNINQKFNIQIFLNEQCKDALNMNDFIKSIEISLEQLDITKNQGLENGLSNAIIENMNKLGVHKRPLHCTDTKRETLYIKENDTWEKDKSKEKIKQAIKDLSHKNYKTLYKWTEENPDFKEHDAKQDYFSHTVRAIGKDIKLIDDKIIKNICNHNYIKDDLEE